MKKILTIILLLFICSSCLTQGIKTETNSISQQPMHTCSDENEHNWFEQVQIYEMVALPHPDAENHYITVNGLWNGFIGDNLSSPFAFGILLESIFSGETYETDQEFVSTQHEKGFIVPATILTTQGHISFQEEQLETFACRSIDGEKIQWDEEANSYWMTATNPEMIEWCIEHGKKAIDAGADMIVLDEIQGDSLIPMAQFAHTYLGIPAPGFSNSTIESFRTYLKETYSTIELAQLYHIDSIDTYDLKNRIAETMHLFYDERVSEDSLNLVYFDFLDYTNFQAKKRLITSLRSYAEEKNQDLVISANSYGLGTSRFAGYWPKGLQFSDLVDCFTYENRYFPVDEILAPFPRNKWLAWEKLTYAATNAPAIAIIDTEMVQQIHPAADPIGINGFSNYLSILCAEAFSNRGSFVDYFIKIWEKETNWEGCKNIYEFIQNNQDIYNTASIIDTPVAILYFYGEGMRVGSDTYLGCAQALAESNIPFEVIFDGDGRYIEETLTLDQITPYEFLIIPSVDQITPSQKQILMEYVSNGGTALVFTPESIGFDPVEGDVSYGAGQFYFLLDNVGYAYYYTYEDAFRSYLENIVTTYVTSPISIEQTQRDLIATPYIQTDEQRMIIHLVNYDHEKFYDTIHDKQDITLTVTNPSIEIGTIKVISPDFNETISITPTITNDTYQLTIPSLHVYNVIIIESQKEITNLIEHPRNNMLIINDRKELFIPFPTTIVIGNINISVQNPFEPHNKGSISFLIDDELQHIDTTDPYYYLWDEPKHGFHTIKIIVYDQQHKKIGQDEMTVLKLL